MNTQDTTLLRRLNQAGAPLDLATLAAETAMPPETVDARLAELAACGFHFTSEESGVELDALPDGLVPEAIACQLDESSAFARDIRVLRQTASTNDFAMRLGEGGAAHGTVVFALEQTGGRGRLGRRWYSPADGGLWFSVLLRPTAPVAHWPRLALAAGLGVARAAERLTSRPIATKWPNDVLVDERKLAGILLESRTDGDAGFVVLGVGINVNAEKFPPEVAAVATSLKLATGADYQLNRVAAVLLDGLDVAIHECECDFDSVRSQCEQRDILIGREIKIRSGAEVLSGHALRLGPHGGVILRQPSGAEIEVPYGEATPVKGIAS